MNSTLSLTREERRALLSLTRSRAVPAAYVKRARLIMVLDEGLNWNAIGERLPCTPDYISRWKAGQDRGSAHQRCVRRVSCRHRRSPAQAQCDPRHLRQLVGPQATEAVEEFLAQHPNVRLHYTPNYSPWLNQVELWLAKIERDVIARDTFSSVPDRKCKLMRYIRQYNLAPKPVKWVYRDPAHRVTTDSRVTAH